MGVALPQMATTPITLLLVPTARHSAWLGQGIRIAIRIPEPPESRAFGVQEGFHKYGALFCGKKAPAATYLQVRGFQDLGTKNNGKLERRSL